MKPTNLLDKLAIKYKADKFGKHSYTSFYHDLFRNRRDEVKKVVEIGAGEGASLFMWEEYFPNARIFSGENMQSRLFKKGRIEVVECDQQFEVDLNRLIAISGTNIDLFIDDGSHDPDDQVFTCLYMMPMIDSNVIYVIEDVADPKILERFSDYDAELVEFKTGRYDDRLIVVRHNE